MRTRVRSLASLGELRIQCCRELWSKLQMQLRSSVAVAVVEAGGYSSDWTLSLGTSICRGRGPRNSSNNNNEKTKDKKEMSFVFTSTPAAVEVPRLWVEPKLQLPAYATATAT